jgi:heat shock protein HslJ
MTAPVRRLIAVTLTLVALGAVFGACSVGGNGLTGSTWQLTAITQKVPAFQGVVPAADQARYTIVFNQDGTATIKADCNQVMADYEATPGGSITITPGASTMAMCPEDSMGTQFVAALGSADSYTVSGTRMTMRLGDEGTLEFLAAK